MSDVFQGTYDPTKCVINVAGADIGGPLGGGTFLKITRNEDAYTYAPGARGGGTRTRNANRSGIIEITVQASSPAMAILSALAAADELDGSGIGAFLFKDNSGAGPATTAEAEYIWVKKQGDIERGKEIGEVTWTLEAADLVIAHNGIVQ